MVQLHITRVLLLLLSIAVLRMLLPGLALVDAIPTTTVVSSVWVLAVAKVIANSTLIERGSIVVLVLVTVLAIMLLILGIVASLPLLVWCAAIVLPSLVLLLRVIGVHGFTARVCIFLETVLCSFLEAFGSVLLLVEIVSFTTIGVTFVHASVIVLFIGAIVLLLSLGASSIPHIAMVPHLVAAVLTISVALCVIFAMVVIS